MEHIFDTCHCKLLHVAADLIVCCPRLLCRVAVADAVTLVRLHMASSSAGVTLRDIAHRFDISSTHFCTIVTPG